ncbi:hypothetical protein P154DRAFT_544776 [Amniculicola lignicola CBS 123094]|uniref:DNA replication checkpoint mediator MRC1 domain-containing protein n=1 Tax=Amniculicola lignicola CBS 123094 TaxID=1392246 RepID=A0A6A5WS48_9PLEO|nr:hypothetical protein P154DRAFT_544776 [Amniculicola lignicola CBS 123094]
MAKSQQKESAKQTIKSPVHAPRVADAISSSDGEDDFPVRAVKARRLVARKEKSASPRTSRSTTPRSRHSSPGLFFTPDASPVTSKGSKSVPRADNSAGSPQRATNTDLEARVKRIRAERQAKQKEAREQARLNKLASKGTHDDSDDGPDSDPDGATGKLLTQSSRPTRKAGKKAMEEMIREQEKIRRNMQLTHQAKTKKRYGAKDLLSRFNFASEAAPIVLPTPEASYAMMSSDVEGNQESDTPPTSPPSQEDTAEKPHREASPETPLITPEVQEKENLVPVLEPTSPAVQKVDKGKGRALEFQHVPVNPLVPNAQPLLVRNALLKPKKPTAVEMVELSDSDDDAKAIQSKSRFPVFDRLPEKSKKESSSLLHLRHLAHLTSPKRKVKGKVSLNSTELQWSLQQKARQQAHEAREEKIEELRARGIHIETEEEREKFQLEIEDLAGRLQKAREEDMKLGKLERDEAKKNGETIDGLVSSDESEDEDYVGSEVEEAGDAEEGEDEEDADVELSGSEEEMDEEETVDPEGLVDMEADEDMDDDTVNAPVRSRAVRKSRNVVLDDDDEEGEIARPSTPKATPTQMATQDDPMAAFGFGKGGVDISLTQAFAGTMADLESDSQAAHPLDKLPEQDSMDFLRSLPDTQPAAFFRPTTDFLVPNSQTQEDTQNGGMSELHLGISQLIENSPVFSRTQMSDVPEPTQDAGFELSRSPAGIAPSSSTVDTIMMSVLESPVVQRKGRLQRRAAKLSDIDDDNMSAYSGDSDHEVSQKAKDAFLALKKGAKKQRKIDNFNKKTSWARDAIEEQAEESEDEYAGIGGASDEDSGEEDEELAKMIDQNDVHVDERQLAQFYADKERGEDERNINQLYKDIMNGNLRKRNGGGDAFDMSDSDDEAEQRRRKKQLEFKKMTAALISDDRIGKLAQNPKQAAFFKTLADHTEDPDYDFLNAPDMMEVDDSQTSESKDETGESSTIHIPDSQPTEPAAPTVNPLKRKSLESDSQKENRPPPNLRRTAASEGFARKPMTIADIQHSVSELLEDPGMHMVPESQYSSDSDLEVEPPVKLTRQPIIDRLSRTNTSSSISSTTSATTSANMAFHAPTSSAHQPGFRVPSLVRRATSNISTVSTGSSGASTPTEGVRRGGTGKSNIHAQAREAERRAKMEKVEGRRKEGLKKKIGALRKGRSILGGLDGGFE